MEPDPTPRGISPYAPNASPTGSRLCTDQGHWGRWGLSLAFQPVSCPSILQSALHLFLSSSHLFATTFGVSPLPQSHYMAGLVHTELDFSSVYTLLRWGMVEALQCSL